MQKFLTCTSPPQGGGRGEVHVGTQHMINKTQEVWINEEFEDDSENGKSINEKKTKGDNQTQKDLLNINNQSLIKDKMKKKSEKVQLLEEVQEKMEISSEFANQQEVEAAIMQS